MKETLVRLSKADNLLVSKSTLYKWSAKGLYPTMFRRIGGMVFVDLSELHRILRAERND